MASDLTFNKIAAGILATGLGIMGLREISAIAFESEPPEKPGYAIDVPEQAEGGGGGPDPNRLLDWGTLLISANPADGATVSKKCTSCHTFEQGGPNGTGPNLFGILGGPVAAHAGFAYSDAMKAHGAEVGGRWTLDDMNAFLLAPQRHIPGTKMTFVGLKKEDERVNILAYMNTMTAAPVPIPAPDPSRQEGPEGGAGGAAPTQGAPTDGGAAQGTTPGAPQGSTGTVPSPAGGTTGTPPTAAGGGMAGQTPVYGQPGQAPQAITVSPGGEEGGRGQGSVSPGGGGTTTPQGTGAAARANPATNPQAQRPTAQPSPAQRAPTRGGPGRVNEGNTNSASPGQPR